MAVVKELLRSEKNDTLSFGDYTLPTKAKVEDFPFHGDVYKVKTFNEITKLEKNGLFSYESVPGTAVTNFKETADGVSFTVEGKEDAQIILGMEENVTYKVYVGGKEAGEMETGMGGKLTLSVELAGNGEVEVKVEK